MDSQAEEEKLKQERLRAANRERVRRHRAQHQGQTPIAKQAPLSSAERVRRYRERKRLAGIVDSGSDSLASASAAQVPKHRRFPSCRRTQNYRQRRQAQQGYFKGLALSDCERSRRYYAKKQQYRLKAALGSRSSELQDNLSTHSQEVS